MVEPSYQMDQFSGVRSRQPHYLAVVAVLRKST